MSVRKTIFVLCTVLYSIHQASSLKCYTCDSNLDGECYKNPKQSKHEKDCPAASTTTTTTTTTPKPNLFNIPVLSELVEASPMEGTPTDADPVYGCSTMIRTMGGNMKMVSRLCELKSKTDEDIKKAAIAAGMTLDFLQRCDADLCNNADSPTAPAPTTPPATPATTKPPAPPTSPTAAPPTSPTPTPTKAPPTVGTKPPGGSTAVPPSSSTTSAPDSSSSSSLTIEFWILACSLFLIFYFKL